jgi:hypothetical protein
MKKLRYWIIVKEVIFEAVLTARPSKVFAKLVWIKNCPLS